MAETGRDLRSIVLLDGGMGQELLRRTGAKPHPLWSARIMIDAPQAVEDLHLDYIRAGARTITLNAYSAEPCRLETKPVGAWSTRSDGFIIRRNMGRDLQAQPGTKKAAGIVPRLSC